MNLTEKKIILGSGYVRYIGHMGSDETFVEAARMSTGKGFYGWYWEEDIYADCVCIDCNTQHLLHTLPTETVETPPTRSIQKTAFTEVIKNVCTNCWGTNIVLIENVQKEFPESTTLPSIPKLLGKKGAKRDLSLLETLYSNRHQTPFEMGELAIEVKAPILVFREWHRHRTQAYNEFSARYSQMPNEHYIPELERFQKQSRTNKQGSAEPIGRDEAEFYRQNLMGEQTKVYAAYDSMVRSGLAKELARINTPVSRMSKMRAKTDIRNWLGFLTLRMDNAAQYEIRQYANAVASIIKQLFPKTFDLFLEYDFLGARFSRTEMQVVRSMVQMLQAVPGDVVKYSYPEGFSDKQKEALIKKLLNNREVEYKDVLEKL